MKYSSVNELFSRLSDLGYTPSTPVDVDRIAEELKIKVEYSSKFKNEDEIGEIEFLSDDEKYTAIIRLNEKQNLYDPRRRFTLAHEIGHFCLHSNGNRSGFIDDKSTMSRTLSYWDAKESQANNFAAQLLMPANLVVEQSDILINRFKVERSQQKFTIQNFVMEMANVFNVSNPAMEYRLKSMGLISQDDDSKSKDYNHSDF
jgi:Zn-dependent peptidase ImmA (M78 family)